MKARVPGENISKQSRELANNSSQSLFGRKVGKFSVAIEFELPKSGWLLKISASDMTLLSNRPTKAAR